MRKKTWHNVRSVYSQAVNVFFIRKKTMALNTNKDLKQYFSIAEVAEMFHVAPTLLRYWEKPFPQIVPRKVGRNIRQYTKDDIEKIRVVYNLVKVRGMKLDAAAALIRKNHSGVSKTTEVVDRLRMIREELVSIKSSLDQLQ